MLRDRLGGVQTFIPVGMKIKLNKNLFVIIDHYAWFFPHSKNKWTIALIYHCVQARQNFFAWPWIDQKLLFFISMYYISHHRLVGHQDNVYFHALIEILFLFMPWLLTFDIQHLFNPKNFVNYHSTINNIHPTYFH